jgi:GNAT superfamily N-acetyltransferase
MTQILIRPAAAADLPAIIAMLADDALGAAREDPSMPLHPRYLQAFAAIAANPDQHLVVADYEGQVIATLQLTLLPGLSKKGAWRGLIEGVRVRTDTRRLGMGVRMIGWAVEQCRERGCASVELVAHHSRTGAHRFYRQLGFKPTHIGFKLDL